MCGEKERGKQREREREGVKEEKGQSKRKATVDGRTDQQQCQNEMKVKEGWRE